MAFIITKDHLENATVSKVRNADEFETARLLNGEGTHFKLYDDDSELYYSGKFLGDSDSEEAFEPLDWATSYAGCTFIKYRMDGGKYEVL